MFSRQLTSASTADKAAAAAIEQINKRGYADKFSPEVAKWLGLAIDPEAKKSPLTPLLENNGQQSIHS